jgi:hypothetical protein
VPFINENRPILRARYVSPVYCTDDCGYQAIEESRSRSWFLDVILA